MRLLSNLANRLIDRSKRTPYFHLEGYMERFWLVPYPDRKLSDGCGPVVFNERPIARLLQRFGIAARIHHILRSDNDRAVHDHPWHYLTIILRGGYFEETRRYDESGLYVGTQRKWYGPGSILFRSAKSQHRLVIPDGRTCWTLFITGNKQQHWGFYPIAETKIYWRDYLNSEQAND